MPRVIRIPPENELPNGPARDFVNRLWRLYKAAHRPTLETISTHIRDGDYAATASKETIRKMLRGASIPTHWQTVEAVFCAMGDLAGWSPEVKTEIMYFAEELWHRALDEPSPDVPISVAGGNAMDQLAKGIAEIQADHQIALAQAAHEHAERLAWDAEGPGAI